MRRLAFLLALLLCALALAPSAGVLAQDATPQASPATGEEDVDLAAMTLDSTAMPEGFTTFGGEQYIDLDRMAEDFVGMGAVASVAEIEALNLIGNYESYYGNEDFSQVIRTYVLAYETPEDVRAGFDLFEDEGRTIPEEEGQWEDAPGLEGIGEAPSEVTTATFQIPDGPSVSNVDVTFRVDRFHLGVSMDTYDGTDPDRDLLEELAEALEARVTAVLAGEEIPGIDTTLPELVPTLDTPFQGEGYRTVADAFGEQADVVDGDAFVSAYGRGGTFAADPQLSPAPELLIGVARFADSQTALDLLENAEDLLPSETRFERAEVDEVAGNPAAGFAFTSGYGPDEPDSFRVIVASDDLLISVEVLGIVSVDDAEELATGFAEDTVACAEDGESCGPLAISPELAVPAASPEAEPDASPAA